MIILIFLGCVEQFQEVKCLLPVVGLFPLLNASGDADESPSECKSLETERFPKNDVENDF